MFVSIHIHRSYADNIRVSFSKRSSNNSGSVGYNTYRERFIKYHNALYIINFHNFKTPLYVS